VNIILPPPAGACLHGRLSSNVRPHATPTMRCSPALRSLLSVLLVSAPHAVQAADWSSPSKPEVDTKLGTLAVARNDTDGSFTLLLGNRTVAEVGKDSNVVFLSNVLKVGSKELVLLVQSSGGIACPTTFVVVEVSETIKMPEPFGNCSPTCAARVEAQTLVITMPRYFAHPESLTERERKRVQVATDTYVWSNGKLHQAKRSQ
jgi:hypothetical protein